MDEEKSQARFYTISIRDVKANNNIPSNSVYIKTYEAIYGFNFSAKISNVTERGRDSYGNTMEPGGRRGDVARCLSKSLSVEMTESSLDCDNDDARFRATWC